MQKLKYCFASS